MYTKVGEECGVAAIVLKKPQEYYEQAYESVGGAAFFICEMLKRLQRRGQESVGIVTFDEKSDEKMKDFIETGVISEAFRERDKSRNLQIMKYLNGERGIGHVRYSTSGGAKTYEDLIREAQPMVRSHGKRWKSFALAFNGNLAKYPELVEELSETYEYDLRTSVDTEAIMHYISIDMKTLEEIKKGKPDIVEVISQVEKRLDGSYNVVMVNGVGEVVAFRDPLGFKPLSFAENDDFFAVASESLALEPLRFEKENIEEVKPGQILIYKDELRKESYADVTNCRNCQFEFVYFMSDASRCFSDDKPQINIIRRRLGQELAKTDPLADIIKKSPYTYLVAPVPDTSIPIAEEYADALDLKYRHAIRVVDTGNERLRAFIEKPGMREEVMKRKYTIIEIVKGKKVIAIDDSFVRGDTTKIVVAQLKAAGAKEVHVRSACPPIRFPCFYGIDFPTIKELIAGNAASVEEAENRVQKNSGADSVHYQTIEGLINAIPSDGLCLACLNGDYPTKYGKIRFQEALEEFTAFQQ